MDVKVDIKPEDVNKMVTDAILESSIGTTLRAAVQKEVGKLQQSWQNPIDAVVAEEVRAVLKHIVANEFRPQIGAKVREALTDALLTKLVDAAWDTFFQRL